MKKTRSNSFHFLPLSYLFLPFLTLLAANVATGQTITPSVINSTGGTATAGNLIVDWNVGESMITAQTNGIIVTTDSCNR